MVFRNVCIQPPHYTAKQPKKKKKTRILPYPLRELQILLFKYLTGGLIQDKRQSRKFKTLIFWVYRPWDIGTDSLRLSLCVFNFTA